MDYEGPPAELADRGGFTEGEGSITVGTTLAPAS
jgi:hypothetical protein